MLGRSPQRLQFSCSMTKSALTQKPLKCLLCPCSQASVDQNQIVTMLFKPVNACAAEAWRTDSVRPR